MVEILFCLMSTLENCLISTYLLWFSTPVQMEKNWEDSPSATLTNLDFTKLHIIMHMIRDIMENLSNH